MAASGRTHNRVDLPPRVGPKRLGAGLSSAAVPAIENRRGQLASLEGDCGTHSQRSGFVTEGASQGIALPSLMDMSEHRSVASLVGYSQAQCTKDNPPGRLLR